MSSHDPSIPADAESPLLIDTRWGWGAALLIVVSAVLHAVAIGHASPLQSANDRSRWCTIRALLEDGTYRIDSVRQRPGWDSIDIYRQDDHFYSTKPPLMATWVAGIVGVTQRISGWTFDADLDAITTTTLCLVNLIPFVFGLILLARWLFARGTPGPAALLTLAVAAFGTLVSPFLTTLNNHTVAATGVWIASLCWLTADHSRGRWWRSCVWGAAAAWAACHDLPAAILVLAGFLVVVRGKSASAPIGYLVGAALPAIAFLAVNVIATGHWKPAYAGYGTSSYLFVHEGVPSYWLQPQGIDQNLDSPAVYVFHCLFGHHGWFSLTPIWLVALFAIPGAIARLRMATPQDDLERGRMRREAEFLIATWGMSIVVFGFYWTRTQNYNYGGVSCGLRWAIFLIPCWTLLLPQAVSGGMTRHRAGQVLSGVLLAVSIYSAWEPMSKAWQQPWLFRTLAEQGWIHYDSPPPPPLTTAPYSWIASLPDDREIEGQRPWIEYRKAALVTGAGERLRVELLPDINHQGRALATVRVTWTTDGRPREARVWQIDRQNFRAGKLPGECLIFLQPATPEEQQRDLALFRGLPARVNYRPGYVRYLRTTLRRDALACQRVAAQVDIAPTDPQSTTAVLRHRSDLWRSSEVPFGTARMEWSVSDVASGEIVQREVWNVDRSFPAIAPTSPLTPEDFVRSESKSR